MTCSRAWPSLPLALASALLAAAPASAAPAPGTPSGPGTTSAPGATPTPAPAPTPGVAPAPTAGPAPLVPAPAPAPGSAPAPGVTPATPGPPTPDPGPPGDVLVPPPTDPAAPAPEPATEPAPEPAVAELPLPAVRTEPPPDPPPAVVPDPSAPVIVEPMPRHRLIYSNALVLRVNPLGLEDRFALMYRRRLSARTGKLWDDTYFGLGITPTFAPSITRIGPTLMLVPLAILQLRASYYFVGYYGSQKFKPHAFDSPRDDYGPDTINGRADAKQGINTYGGQAELSALFQVKFGPIALRDEVIFFHNMIKLPAPNDVYYDLRHDILAPGKGWFVSNDTDLLYTNAKIRLNAGVRATYYHIFYPEGTYELGDKVNSDNDSARVGPLVSYSFKDRPGRRFTKPTLYFVAQWWVKSRYRAGQEVHQGLPLMVLGFSFTGELWRKP